MRIILLITCMGSMMAPLDSTIVSVSLPVMSSDLRMSSETAIWIPTAYLVSLAVLLLTVGRLSDIKGRKNIFIIGFGIFVLGSLLCSVSQDGEQMIVFRVLQGIGAACIGATATAIITDTFPAKERGKALGINAMAVYIGLSLGPALGGLLTGVAGWRSIFWINIPIGIVVMILAWRYVRDTGEIRRDEKLDIPGVLLFSVGLTSLLIALTLGEQYGWTTIGIIGLIVLAVVSLVAFVIVERRKGRAAMLDTSLITGNRLFAAANFSALLNYAAYFSVAFMLSYYMQEILGYSIIYTGLVLLVMPVVMAVLSPISGWASDKIGSRFLASAGMAIIAIGLLFMSALTPASSVIYIAVGLLVIGAGMGLFSSPNTSAVMGCVERKRLGVASGTLSTMRFVGQAVSLAIMGAIIASVAGPDFIATLTLGTANSAVTAEAFVRGMSGVFLAGALIAAVGTVTSLARGKPDKCEPGSEQVLRDQSH
ncbi:MAG TPA: MFS transporter [Methanomassiliicoccales archaeon]